MSDFPRCNDLIKRKAIKREAFEKFELINIDNKTKIGDKPLFLFYGRNVYNRLRHRALNKKVGSNHTRDWVQALPAGRNDRI